MQQVLVLSSSKKPLMPCHPARARELLKKGKAKVYHRVPFTIILIDRDDGDTQPVAIKVDPGSRTTGIALVADGQNGKRVVWSANLKHKGQAIKEKLEKRRAIRRSRRHRKTRYRKARFDNRAKPRGWFAPSIISRLDNIKTWFNKLSRWCPLDSISYELVKFDTQLMDNPDITGMEYQQGTLQGYEVREYLLEKYSRKCAYCGAKDTRLEIEHLTPKARGGSNRIDNLALACQPCNIRKGTKTAQEFGFPELHKKAQKGNSMRDIAITNAIRWKLYEFFVGTGLPVETGTGAQTKQNRYAQGYHKDHWIDAVCVGDSGQDVWVSPTHTPLLIKATGRQSRQMCRVDKYGFPRTSAKGNRIVHGFRTGDLVKAVVTKGKRSGAYVGRVAVRARGSFNIATKHGTVTDIRHSYCRMLQFSDGYQYA